MVHAERRGLVQGFLDDLRAQREVDLRDVLEELIHVVFALDEELKLLDERVLRLEERAGDRS
jgi:hypothetical protein